MKPFEWLTYPLWFEEIIAFPFICYEKIIIFVNFSQISKITFWMSFEKTRTKVQSVGREYFCTCLTFIFKKLKLVSIDNSTRVSRNLSFPLSFSRIVNWSSFKCQFDQGRFGLVAILEKKETWTKKLIVGRLIATHWPTEKIMKLGKMSPYPAKLGNL